MHFTLQSRVCTRGVGRCGVDEASSQLGRHRPIPIPIPATSNTDVSVDGSKCT